MTHLIIILPPASAAGHRKAAARRGEASCESKSKAKAWCTWWISIGKMVIFHGKMVGFPIKMVNFPWKKWWKSGLVGGWVGWKPECSEFFVFWIGDPSTFFFALFGDTSWNLCWNWGGTIFPKWLLRIGGEAVFIRRVEGKRYLYLWGTSIGFM